MGRLAPRVAGAPGGGGATGLEPGLGWTARPSRRKKAACDGAEPTDCGKPGTKRRLVADARGTPLGAVLSGANRHDSMMSGERLRSTLGATLDAIPDVRSGRRGRPRCRPGKLHAGKAYDSRRCRRECRERGITPRIARKGVDSSQRLGRHRWVVERTHAWVARLRRLTVRYEERDDIHLAFTLLGCALVCLNQIKQFC